LVFLVLLALIPEQEIYSTIFRDDKTFEVSSTLFLKNSVEEVIETSPLTFDRLSRKPFGLRFKESQSILPIENIISKSNRTPVAFNISLHAHNG
jgi:hypothetical protein